MGDAEQLGGHFILDLLEQVDLLGLAGEPLVGIDLEAALGTPLEGAGAHALGLGNLRGIHAGAVAVPEGARGQAEEAVGIGLLLAHQADEALEQRIGEAVCGEGVGQHGAFDAGALLALQQVVVGRQALDQFALAGAARQFTDHAEQLGVQCGVVANGLVGRQLQAGDALALLLEHGQALAGGAQASLERGIEGLGLDVGEEAVEGLQLTVGRLALARQLVGEARTATAEEAGAHAAFLLGLVDQCADPAGQFGACFEALHLGMGALSLDNAVHREVEQPEYGQQKNEQQLVADREVVQRHHGGCLPSLCALPRREVPTQMLVNVMPR